MKMIKKAIKMIKKKKLQVTNLQGHVHTMDYDSLKEDQLRESPSVAKVEVITVEEREFDNTKPFKAAGLVDGERVKTEAIYFNGKNIADVEEFTGCDLIPVNPVVKNGAYYMQSHTVGFSVNLTVKNGKYLTRTNLYGRKILLIWQPAVFRANFEILTEQG
jgi:hypothetical protein